MNEAVIVGACRTAIGKFSGTLSGVPASSLGSSVIMDILKRTGTSPEIVNEVILGQVLTAGVGQNPARQAAMGAGIPKEVPALTINQVCGSGLRAVHLGAQSIICGESEVVIAGGQENMSASPHVLNNSRLGMRLGDGSLTDTMVYDGLTDVFNQYHMGITAENIAEKYGVSREDQDAFALSSQAKASKAQKEGKFVNEITPIEIRQRRGDPIIFDKDEFVRGDTTTESLSSLRPAFRKDGSVTAGNASGINDGAAVLLLMNAKTASSYNLEPMATIRSGASCGVDPSIMGMGPVPAARKCLEKSGWKAEDLGMMEINEAFAAQAIAVNREMNWDTEKVNVSGGAIALGHPIGASGARVLVTLLHGMSRENVKKGMASLCIGGGMGIALTVER